MKKKSTERDSFSKNRESVIHDLFADIPELNFRGNREIIIEGSRGVLEYSQELIRINTSIGLVCFFGRGLNLKCISSSELIIEGFVTKAEFIL